MCTGATQVKSLQGRSILGPTNKRSEGKNLVESLFAVMNVSATKAISLLEIEWGDYLSRENQLFQLRRVPRQKIDDRVGKLVTTSMPIAFFQLVRRKLN